MQPPSINSIYRCIFNTSADIIDLWGGRGRGGSYFATFHTLVKLTTEQFARIFFVRKAHKDIRDSLFRDLLDRIGEWGIEDQFDITRHDLRVIHRPTGNEVLSKGVISDGSRTAKMKSLAGATMVVIEEADELDEDDFNQLAESVRTIRTEHTQIIRIFNPPGRRHWIWKDYNLYECLGMPGYYTAKPKSDSGILSIFGTYLDNAINLQTSFCERLERYATTDPVHFNRITLGLIGEGAIGKVFTGWHVCTLAEWDAIPTAPTYVIDFGFSADPTAVLAVKRQGNRLYLHELIYQSGLTTLALSQQLNDLGITHRSQVIADSAEPRTIAELYQGFQGVEGYPELRHGFMISPARKGADSIRAGIALVQGREIHMTEGSANGWMEYQEYKWALDKYKEPTDHPIDKYNHLMDCLRMFVNSDL